MKMYSSTHHYADGGVCLSPQNTFGVTGINNFAAKSNTIEDNHDSFKRNKTIENLNIQIWLETAPCFKPKSLLPEVTMLADVVM